MEVCKRGVRVDKDADLVVFEDAFHNRWLLPRVAPVLEAFKVDVVVLVAVDFRYEGVNVSMPIFLRRLEIKSQARGTHHICSG